MQDINWERIIFMYASGVILLIASGLLLKYKKRIKRWYFLKYVYSKREQYYKLMIYHYRNAIKFNTKKSMIANRRLQKIFIWDCKTNHFITSDFYQNNYQFHHFLVMNSNSILSYDNAFECFLDAHSNIE
jgi:hypothetical protein